MISGIIDGAKLSTTEFIPSIFGCCRGILHGLWAFACCPTEVSSEMINAAYALGEFISIHSAEECLQCVVPELKELSLSWNKINDYSRGQKIGFIIGKYGIDIFVPVAVVKGISKLKALKRANTLCTLENCAASQVKQAKILEESTRRASTRATLIESAKKGQILIKSSNVQYRVMQEKHCWNKLVQLSGNVEEDFKKVIFILEDNKIINPKNLRNIEVFPRNTSIKSIQLLEYRATIAGQEVQVFVEKYTDTGEIFLKNAWIVKKKDI